jgi:hypothetical protein
VTFSRHNSTKAAPLVAMASLALRAALLDAAIETNVVYDTALRRLKVLNVAYECMPELQRACAAGDEAVLRARMPPGPSRDVSEAVVHEHIGNQRYIAGNLGACKASYERAARLLARGGGDADVQERRSQLSAHLALNQSNLAIALGTAKPDDMSALEDTWALVEAHRDGSMASQWADAEGTPVSTCSTALGRCSSIAQRDTWLRRAFSLPLVQTAARNAAARACRFCLAPPEAGAKLRRCAGRCAGRVAYCRAECQRADWARHKACCAEATPDLAIADAACVSCGKPLIDAVNAAGAECSAADAHADPAELTGDEQVFLLHCLHVAHVRCSGFIEQSPCPACEAGAAVGTVR